MSKFLKKTFGLAIVVGLGYLGLKLYKIIKGVMKLSKNLPEFLTNVYGEKPSISINQHFRSLHVKVGFSKEILEKNSDIEAIILEYVEDFYPELSKDLKIDLYDKETKTDECNCCEDDDCDCDCGDDCKCQEEETTPEEEV
ncbi:MAG: hypothetical protein JXR56_02820 [Candidatus Cloacimonetes bacterium]|nr:hypothetical protein [Candidatus Cloacimonadota bacterium]